MCLEHLSVYGWYIHVKSSPVGVASRDHPVHRDHLCLQLVGSSIGILGGRGKAGTTPLEGDLEEVSERVVVMEW